MSEESLQEKTSALWEKTQSHFYISSFSKLNRTFSPREITLAFAKEVAHRSTQKKYDVGFRHAMMGLETAWQLSSFYRTKSRWLPIGQMGWYGLCEASQDPVDFKKVLGPPPLSEELNFETLKKVYATQDFQKIFPLVVFLMRNPKDRKKFFAYLMSHVLSDELNMGNKAIYLCKTWHFCEAMKWENYAEIWFPVLHYILNTKPHLESYPIVEVFYNQNWKTLLAAIQKDDVVFPKEQFDAFREGIYQDERSQTLEKILRWIQEGQSLKSLFEVIKLSASDIVFQSSFERWVTAIYPLIYVESLESCCSVMDPQDQVKALFMSALLVKKWAILSKPFETPEQIPLKTIDEKNSPQYFLEYHIKHGRVAEALGALDEMIQTQKINEFTLELFAFCACKNDYTVMFAHDLKFAYASLHSYRMSHHPLKEKYLKALTKLLAMQSKNPTLYHSLCNTQRIRLGYFSVDGDFNF